MNLSEQDQYGNPYIAHKIICIVVVTNKGILNTFGNLDLKWHLSTKNIYKNANQLAYSINLWVIQLSNTNKYTQDAWQLKSNPCISAKHSTSDTKEFSIT